MKLRQKVAVVVSTTTAFAAMVVGAGVLTINFDSSISNISKRLDNLVTQLGSSKDDPLTAALNEVVSQDVTLVYLQADGTKTVLQQAAGDIGSSTVVRRWVNLGFGERLIFGVSTASVLKSRDDSIWLAMWFSLLASLVSGIVAWLLMASDLKLVSRLIFDAEKIANGEKVTISNTKGRNELQQLARALDQMVSRLQDSKDQMQHFLSDASHELRTPLTVIRGYLEILSKHQALDSEQINRAVERAQSSTLRMQKLIADLLTLAELGEFPEITREPLRFDSIYTDMVSDLKANQPDRPIEVIDGQQTSFEASRELITQFFSNAFANVRSHTPSKAKLRITIMQTESGVQMDLDDAGPGIASLTLDSSRTVFKRFDEARSGGGESSGLGLSIMAKTIELHGGEMQLSRSELGGLRVSAFLPAKYSHG